MKGTFNIFLAGFFLALNFLGVYMIGKLLLPRFVPDSTGMMIAIVALLIAILISITGTVFYYRSNPKDSVALSIIVAGCTASVLNLAALAIVIYGIINP